MIIKKIKKDINEVLYMCLTKEEVQKVFDVYNIQNIDQKINLLKNVMRIVKIEGSFNNNFNLYNFLLWAFDSNEWRM